MEAIRLYQEVGGHRDRAHALNSLGALQQEIADSTAAMKGEAQTLSNLGDIMLRTDPRPPSLTMVARWNSPGTLTCRWRKRALLRGSA